jgi:hypothetical protein
MKAAINTAVPAPPASQVVIIRADMVKDDLIVKDLAFDLVPRPGLP